MRAAHACSLVSGTPVDRLVWSSRFKNLTMRTAVLSCRGSLCLEPELGSWQLEHMGEQPGHACIVDVRHVRMQISAHMRGPPFVLDR